MRHRRAKTKLGGKTGAHRRAMQANLLAALVEHGRVETTERKARDLRRVAERAIARATALGDVLVRDKEELSAEERARLVHVVRQLQRTIRNREATLRLVGEWAPRYLERPGGYTRTFKLGRRRGDAAPMAAIEFLPDPHPVAESGEGDGEKKRKGPFSFLRR